MRWPLATSVGITACCLAGSSGDVSSSGSGGDGSTRDPSCCSTVVLNVHCTAIHQPKEANANVNRDGTGLNLKLAIPEAQTVGGGGQRQNGR